MKKVKIVTVFLLVAVCFSMVFSICAGANSAEVEWEGSGSQGIVITDKGSPLAVESELLTFEIPEFPQFYAGDEDPFSEYSAKVTAEYKISNTADYKVTSRLLFPFGKEPIYYDYWQEAGEDFDDIGKFSITVNGEPADYTIRHTYSDKYYEFDLEEQLSRFSDEYIRRGIFAPETQVVRYTFSPQNIPEKMRHILFSLVISEKSERPMILDNFNYFKQGNGDYKIGVYAGEDDKIIICAMGGSIPELEDATLWSAHENASFENELESSLILEKREEMSFLDLMMTSYDENGEVSRVDWFNALVCYLYEYSKSSNIFQGPSSDFDISASLMRWFDYSISVDANGSITNAVSAPVYPRVNGRYSPNVYQYTYFSTPAKTWSQFGELKVVINTPYEMVKVAYTDIDTSQPDFVKTETGYEVTYEALPDYDITFTLCEVSDPEWISYSSGGSPCSPPELITVLTVALGIFVAGLCVCITVITVKAFKKAKKNKNS